MIPAALPFSGVGNTFCLVHFASTFNGHLGVCLLANLSRFALDFAARQKVGGQHLNFFIKDGSVEPVVPERLRRVETRRKQQDDIRLR